MISYEALLDDIVRDSQAILEDNLVGVYLHGSAAMGCFNQQKSDIDLLVVVKENLEKETKCRYLDMVVAQNALAPENGIELSIVREAVCRHFVYPTPFDLHFSIAHLARYQADPEEYIANMQGTDRDLAAHFTIIYHRGKTLYGKEIQEVFEEVGSAFYWDSILSDVQNAVEEIENTPVYTILNLCRVLVYKRSGLILSKQEGGEWGIAYVLEKYRDVLSLALAAYRTGGDVLLSGPLLREYAAYMLAKIVGE